MPIKKKINDSIRVKILDSLKKKRALTPNIRQIQKITGFHRATIKSSINFLEEKGFIKGYRPLLDPSIAGYKQNTWSFVQIKQNNTAKYKKFKKIVKEDSNVFHCSQVITDKYTNIAIGYLCKSVEDYYKNLQKKYYMNISNVFDFMKDRKIYYLTDPIIKNKSKVDTTIDLLKEDIGVE